MFHSNDQIQKNTTTPAVLAAWSKRNHTMRDRCIKVIDSCSSIEQLKGAMEYASLARPYLTEDDIDDIRYRSFWKMLYLTKTA